MNEYEQKKQARIERYRNRANNAEAESESRWSTAKNLMDAIPFGQPILYDHHSAPKHRAHIKKVDKNLEKMHDALERAKYWEHKAHAAEANRAISSDDPDALPKLRRKLEYLESQQERMKAVNAAHKRFQKNPASLEDAELTEQEKEAIRNYVPRYSWEPHPFPPYCLSNNNGNMRNVRQRIEQLEKLAERAEEGPTETTIGNVRIVDNVDINRCQVFFPEKPSEEIRKLLKSYGFRWSPSESAWQRQISNAATYGAQQVAKKYEQE